MSLTSRDKKLLAVVLVLLVVCGYWFLLLKPGRAELATLSSKLTAQQDMLNSARQQISTYTQAAASDQSILNDLNRLGKAVPKDDAISSLLVQLDGLAGSEINFTKIGIKKYPPALLAPSLGTATTAVDPAAAGSATPAAAGSPPAAGSSPTAGSTPAAGGGTTASQPAAGSTSGTSAALPGAAPDSTTGSAVQLQPIEIELKFQGDFFKIQQLLADMDRTVLISDKDDVDVTGRLIFVQGLHLTTSQSDPSRVSVQLSALVFSLPEEVSFGDQGSGLVSQGRSVVVNGPQGTQQPIGAGGAPSTP